MNSRKWETNGRFLERSGFYLITVNLMFRLVSKIVFAVPTLQNFTSTVFRPETLTLATVSVEKALSIFKITVLPDSAPGTLKY